MKFKDPLTIESAEAGFALWISYLIVVAVAMVVFVASVIAAFSTHWMLGIMVLLGAADYGHLRAWGGA